MTREHVNGSRHVIDLDDEHNIDPRQRSRQSNGRMPREVDGRSANARRLRDLTNELTADLGEPPDATQRALIARAAALMLSAERLEVRLAAGEDIDADQLVRLSRATVRVLHQLGLADLPTEMPKRRRRDRNNDGMDVQQYLASIGLAMEGAEPPVAVAVIGDATGLDELDEPPVIRRHALPPVAPKVDDDEPPRRQPRRGDDE